MSQAEQEWTPSVNPWIIAFTVMLATFMEILDTSVANVALPSIAGNLSASVDESTWVLTSYLVSNAIILPLSGWFCALFGRKRFYLICVSLFTVSSILCGLAPNLESLVFFRILQGIGGGALVPTSQAILVESFPQSRQGAAMAFFGMGVMFAPVIGPALGGWITDNYSWRWIFLINLPVGLVAFLLTQSLVTDPPYLERKDWKKGLHIDYLGISLLAIGLGCLQMVLDNGQRKDWFSSTEILWFSIVTVMALTAAIFWELRHRDPVVDLRLMQERNFCLSNIIMFMVGFIIYASVVLYPFYLQNLMGYTAEKSGQVLSPSGLVIFISMPLVGWLLTKVEARWLMLIGLLAIAGALYRMTSFNLQIDYVTAVKARMLQGFGEAFLFVPITAAAFYFIAREKTSQATGLMNLARNIGGSMGIAFITTLLTRRAQFHQQVLVGHLNGMDGQAQELLIKAKFLMISKGSNSVEAGQQSYALLYKMVQQQAAMLAFVEAFWVLSLVAAMLVPLIFLMKKSSPQKGLVVGH